MNVSIIIPCRNAERHIADCINAILESGFPHSRISELIVCDGLSTDETPQIVQKIATQFPFIRLLNNPQQTVPFALNQGIAATTAPIIVRMDAHSTMQKGYINHGLEVLAAHPEVGNVGGVVVNYFENENAEAIAAAMQSRFGVGNASFRIGDSDGYVDTVPFGIFRREVFEKTGLFDTMLTRNQDDEMNFRIERAGYKIYLDRRIKAGYTVRGSFQKLANQYFQYGYFKVFVNKKHQTVTSIRQLIPMLFVMGLLLGTIASFFSDLLLTAFVFVLGLYCLLGFLTAFHSNQASNNSFLKIFKIFRAFVTLHLSYGAGYWRGIFDFILLKKQSPNNAFEQQS
jgi:glycosyltransferase involved in cell wall biosynthesis